MPYTRSRIFDDVAKLMTDAAGAAQGVRRDLETIMRSQAERVLREFDVPTREEVEAVRDMARIAREENERLIARVEALEARLGGSSATGPAAAEPSGRSAGPFQSAPGATAAAAAPPDATSGSAAPAVNLPGGA